MAQRSVTQNAATEQYNMSCTIQHIVTLSHLSEKYELPAHAAVLCHSDKAIVSWPHFFLSHTEEQEAMLQ